MAEFDFPEGFLWGAATSAHQVEGNNFYNDWWRWEQAGGVKELSGKACSHYTLFEKDFALAKSLFQNAHRFSIEWSRIEPREGEWNDEAIEHYGRVIEALRDHGLEPIVTLHHFTNPVWFLDKGGWENEELLSYFERYVLKIAEAYGKQVRYWITFNEPLVYVFQSYLMGLWPPGVKSFPKGLHVFRNLLIGHQKAYRAIHEMVGQKWRRRPEVSLAQHLVNFTPCGKRLLRDSFSTWLRHWFNNRFPSDALTTGQLFFPGIFSERLPLKKTLDFMAINYYRREHIHFDGWKFPGFFGETCPAEHHPVERERRSDMGWEIYPRGFYQSLMRLARYRLPIMITENGVADREDRIRWPFIQRHLVEMVRAMKRGCPVIGYLYWSLLDNFEWSDGYGPRFGLIEVDYTSQARKIRAAARVFSDICQHNRIEMK